MNQRLKVRLTPEQIAYATSIGRQRHATHSQIEDPRVDTSRDGELLHMQGACAEMAVSVALKRPWDGAFQKLAEWRIWRRIGHDVDGLQVRSTNSTTGGLCVHKSDPDQPFILVLDRDAPEYVLAGWIMGSAAKLDMYWDETLMSKRPCYLVPQVDLRSCAELAREPAQTGGGSGYRRDPAPDFGGGGKWPQRRYADDGSHPSTYGNVVPASVDLPCCRCQTLILKGQPLGGNLVTGTIHGDPTQCRMKKRGGSR